MERRRSAMRSWNTDEPRQLYNANLTVSSTFTRRSQVLTPENITVARSGNSLNKPQQQKFQQSPLPKPLHQLQRQFNHGSSVQSASNLQNRHLNSYDIGRQYSYQMRSTCMKKLHQIQQSESRGKNNASGQEQIDSSRMERLFGSTQMSFIAAPSAETTPVASSDSKRFTPFATILRGSAGWVDFARKNQPEEIGVREILKNQLIFNQTQKNFLLRNLERERTKNLGEVIQVYRTHETKMNLPKIKVKTQQESVNALLRHHEKMQQQQALFDTSTPNKLEEKDAFAATQAEEKNEVKNIHIKFTWYAITDDSWRPDTREFPTFTLLSGKLYMYGGMGNEIYNNLCVLDLSTWKWRVVDNAEQLNEGRYGHTSHAYKKDLVIVCGEKKYNSHLKMRPCYSDVQTYSFASNSWSQLRIYGDIIETRRNHTSIIINKFLFIYGGINSYNKHLNDVTVVNMETLKCMVMQTEGGDSRGIAFHTMCAVFRGEIRMENPNFPIDFKRVKEKKMRKIKEEGIYAFGGLYQNSEASSVLRVLRLGMKPLKWVVPDTKGIAPMARYQHGMHYYDDLNVLIVYGGRNENLKLRNAAVDGNGIMSDVYVLDLECLNWISVDMVGLRNIFRCGFTSLLVDTKILVFGGYSESGLVNTGINILELDQSKNRRLAKDNTLLKFTVTVADLINSTSSDLFDLGLTSNERKRRTSKQEEDEINPFDGDEPTDDPSKSLGLLTYQPFPKRDQKRLLKSTQQQQSQLVANVAGAKDQPKFKMNSNGIPSLFSCSDSDEDDQPIQSARIVGKKRGKQVSYLIS